MPSDLTAKVNAAVLLEFLDQLDHELLIWKLEDSEDPGTFRLIYSNHDSSPSTGAHSADLVGSSMREAFPALLETELPQAYLEVLRSGRPKAFPPLQYGSPGQEQRVWSIRAYPLAADLVGVCVEDVTSSVELSRHAAELEQRVRDRTEALEAANSELESFSYSVSHDLRAPLRAMEGYGDALLEDYADKLDERATSYVHRIQAGAKRLDRLICGLLELARAAQAPAVSTPVDLSALAEELASDLRASSGERTVDWEIEPGLVADTDPQLARLILQNLLGNAWKFTANRKPGRIELGRTEQDGRNVYFVRDNGAGFDMAYAEKLFSPFARLHSGTEFEGDGVGLATVERVMRRLGGEIWAEGAVGEGATFHFTL